MFSQKRSKIQKKYSDRKYGILNYVLESNVKHKKEVAYNFYYYGLICRAERDCNKLEKFNCNIHIHYYYRETGKVWRKNNFFIYFKFQHFASRKISFSGNMFMKTRFAFFVYFYYFIMPFGAAYLNAFKTKQTAKKIISWIHKLKLKNGRTAFFPVHFFFCLTNE